MGWLRGSGSGTFSPRLRGLSSLVLVGLSVKQAGRDVS